MSLRPHLILLFLCTLTLIAAAADAPTRPAIVPIVDVTTADGKVVHGRLLNADGLEVTIQPTAPGQAEQTVPWKNIRRVSNGLTQQKAFDAWKTAHKDTLCDTCKGERLLACATCKGTGHDLASRKDCPACKGAGLTACAAPRCDKGQVPCPATCLKLSVGSWTMHEGKRARTFPAANGGTLWISEEHVGQIVDLVNGKASGSTTVCPTCNGKTTINCPVCHGTAQEPCKTCISSTSPECPDPCDHGLAKCAACEGTGLKKL